MNSALPLVLVLVGMTMVLKAKQLSAKDAPADAEKARWLRVIGTGLVLGAALVLVLEVANVAQDHAANDVAEGGAA